ncbi:MAG TPA: NAD(P)-binding domain-containing protein [Thermoleophilaceae bacterium]
MHPVCVIGAGSSGLAVLKELCGRGIEADCLESRDGVGGLWRYSEDPAVGHAYAALHPNTSRPVMSFAGHPMPPDWPDYPSHEWILRYLEDFVEHFGLARHIELGRTVERAEPRDDGNWRVVLDGGEERTYRAVVVASGASHGAAIVPPLAGTFEGLQLHAGHYRRPDPFAGLRVCVVGLGASAADLAVDLSRVAEKVWLSARSGVWIVPRMVGSKPLDQLNSPVVAKVPTPIRRFLERAMWRAAVGKPSDYGLPEPTHPVGTGPYTITSSLLPAIRMGQVWPRPGIARLEPRAVVFTDDTREEVDAIVWCTGYRVEVPYLPAGLVAGGECPPLFLRVVHPEVDGLFFAALLQPLGSTFPIAEAQSRLIADALDGSLRLPPREEMRRRAVEDARLQRRRFARPSRGLMVDPAIYLPELERENRALRRGR